MIFKPVSKALAASLTSVTFSLMVVMLLMNQGITAQTENIAILVSHNSTLSNISEREIRRLFLGKSIKLPNGSRAALAIYEPLRTEFNTQALKRSDAQVSAAWSRLKFSGRNREPLTFSDPAALLDFVATTPNAIAYGLSEYERDDIRQILTIP